MPEAFQYLLRPPGEAGEGRPPGSAVDDAYPSKEALAGRLVVRQEEERGGRFLVFASAAELGEWYGALPPAKRTCHEVVFGAAPQRLKFDVDAPAAALAPLAARLAAARAEEFAGFGRLLEEAFGALPPPRPPPPAPPRGPRPRRRRPSSRPSSRRPSTSSRRPSGPRASPPAGPPSRSPTARAPRPRAGSSPTTSSSSPSPSGTTSRPRASPRPSSRASPPSSAPSSTPGSTSASRTSASRAPRSRAPRG